jgi:GR25 family glycosyltransferase involved in LPS biosynthesis
MSILVCLFPSLALASKLHQSHSCSHSHSHSTDAVVSAINLERDTERWDKLLKDFQQKNVPMDRVHRINAVHGKALSSEQLRSSASLKARLFGTRGTIGCYMSHRLVWNKVMPEDSPFSRLSRKDDAAVSQDFCERAEAMVKELDENPEARDAWDALLLGGLGCINPNQRYGPYHIAAFCTGGSRPPPRRVTEHCHVPKRPHGTHAHVLSKRGAANLLTLAPRITYHVDVVMWGLKGLNLLICDPLLAFQDDSPSTVGAITSGIETWIPSSIRLDNYTNMSLEWVWNEPILRIPIVKFIVTQGRYLLFGVIGIIVSSLLFESHPWLLPAHLAFLGVSWRDSLGG